MRAYRLGVALLLTGLAAGFLFLDLELIPARLQRSVQDLFPKTRTDVSIAALLAPPPSADALAIPKGSIPFKRSLEEPANFQLTPPLVGNLGGSKLETMAPSDTLPREGLFPISPAIVSAVNFWKSLYAEYSSDQVIIHDSRYLGQVYDVLDFAEIRNRGMSHSEFGRFVEERIEEKTAEIDGILARLDEGQGRAQRLSPEEARIWQMWTFLGERPDRFHKARERVRWQRGLQEEFAAALERSGSYLPYMEEIFLNYQIPPEITRLVFVESMFVNSAVSKTGAAGFWQFMPKTAKQFMKMNEWVDERLDPFIATHAAARLLRSNFEMLGSWPLAINAYNSGAGRIRQAIRRLGTDDIGVIISQFTGRGYGFASRNFYPEFVAALEIVDNYQQYFGELPIEEPITYEVVELPDRASIDDIAEILEIDMGSLQDLNPAFLQALFDPTIFLPKGASIRVPLGEGNRVMTGVYNLARQPRNK